MGQSKSKSQITQDINNKYINNETINIVNKFITETFINISQTIVSNCTSSAIGRQNITINDLTAEGDIIISGNQKQQIYYDFQCMQQNDVKTEIANQLVDKLLQQLSTNVKNDLFNQMKASVDSKSKAGAISLPFTSSDADADVNQSINNELQNNIKKDLTNVMKTVTKATISQKFMNDCVGKVIAQQDFSVVGAKAGGSITIGVDQEQLIKTFTNCIQASNIGTRLITDAAYTAGIDVEGGYDNKVKNVHDAQAEASAETQSVIDELSNLLTSVLDAIIPDFGLIGSSVIGSSISSSSLCCCFFLIILLIPMISRMKR